MGTSAKRTKAEAYSVAAVVVIWALAFGVYLVNTPNPSILGLSSACATPYVVDRCVSSIHSLRSLRPK